MSCQHVFCFTLRNRSFQMTDFADLVLRGVYINAKFAINLHYSYKQNLAIKSLCIFYKPRN